MDEIVLIFNLEMNQIKVSRRRFKTSQMSDKIPNLSQHLSQGRRRRMLLVQAFLPSSIALYADSNEFNEERNH